MKLAKIKIMQIFKPFLLLLFTADVTVGKETCKATDLACNCRGPQQGVKPGGKCAKAIEANFHENGPGKIINGEDVPPGEYPWFTRFVNKFDFEWEGCGGSLITPEFVLTAAHCISPNTDLDETNLAVEIGRYCTDDISNCGEPFETINVADVYVIPSYDASTFNNDYALLRLETRSTAMPVKMDPGYVDDYPEGQRNLWPIGFGNTGTSLFCVIFGCFPTHLQHVEVAFVPSDECDEAYNQETITDAMMCAADPGEDACQGDSGGPLYDKDNDVLVGITSWGYGCADPDYPGVYSKVSKIFHQLWTTLCSRRFHSFPKPAECSCPNFVCT